MDPIAFLISILAFGVSVLALGVSVSALGETRKANVLAAKVIADQLANERAIANQNDWK